MSTSGGTTRFRLDEGDWVCPDAQCANVNFARRSTCNRCGKGIEKSAVPPKKKLGHEIGKAAAEKSRGLFSADDWQCGRCGNVNWARRQQCNMCNAPKYGEVEERTGLGGGYNEREDVEYIEREESDGEYDDFGRKKKKFRGNEDGSEDENKPRKAPEREAPEKAPPIPVEREREKVKEVVKNHKLESEEEEEEDEDDGDLSKYDLSGWGDDDDDDAVKDEVKSKRKDLGSEDDSTSSSQASKESKRSHSRSSSPESRTRNKRNHSGSSSGGSSDSREKSDSPLQRGR